MNDLFVLVPSLAVVALAVSTIWGLVLLARRSSGWQRAVLVPLAVVTVSGVVVGGGVVFFVSMALFDHG